jgi:hypothetical protein
MLPNVRGYGVGRRDAGARQISPCHVRGGGVKTDRETADIGKHVRATNLTAEAEVSKTGSHGTVWVSWVLLDKHPVAGCPIPMDQV